jgi:O-acetyl-ADP-ribose deacetylase (regulator of RNase III)
MHTKLVVIQGDISQLKVDAIVQASDLDECLQVREDRALGQTEECLNKAYQNSLNWAVSRKAKTVAFPNVNDPHLSFSKNKAAFVALTAVRNFVIAQPGQFTEIIFVCWDTENYHLYKEMLGGENRAV